ncbi:hypothetical protein V9W64_10740 [Neisseria leonii]|uniref:Uncharacterized protein n=1 Tax=Neisseria leonii TaxID=2995413 RepID=A0A9X4DZG5_9NEIS|nr:hypothetical protein [Neisseria sp. 51.81]MDD9326718.1 hypothetical protein [Neisseria sp. 51.81]
MFDVRVGVYSKEALQYRAALFAGFESLKSRPTWAALDYAE